MIKLICYIYQWLLSKLFSLELMTPSNIPSIKNREVHIFVSGGSAKETYRIVPEDAIKICANLAVKLNLKWDYIFCERADGSNYQDLFIQSIVDNNDGDLIIKNMYPNKFMEHFLNIPKLKKNGLKFILSETQLRKKSSKFPIQDILNVKQQFLQFESSVFTMIAFAYYQKAKVIYVHGLDFGGESLHPESTVDISKYEHHKNIYYILKDILRQKGVILRRAKL